MRDPFKVMRMITLRSGLDLERKGMKRSRGLPSAYSLIKKEWGLRGNKEAVYTQFCEIVEAEKGK